MVYSSRDILDLVRMERGGSPIPVTNLTEVIKAGALPVLTADGIRALPIDDGRQSIQPVPQPGVGIGAGALPGTQYPLPYFPNVPVTTQPAVTAQSESVGAILAWLIANAPRIVALAGGVAGLTSLLTGGGIGGGGGSTSLVVPGTDIVLQGPGLKEPYPQMIVKEWKGNGAQFYKLLDGRIAVYNIKKKTWKAFRPKKNIVVSSDPRVGALLSVSGKIDRLMRSLAKKSTVLRYGKARR